MDTLTIEDLERARDKMASCDTRPLKVKLLEKFEVCYDEEELEDIFFIFPEKAYKESNMVEYLSQFDWIIYSEYTDKVIILNKKKVIEMILKV